MADYDCVGLMKYLAVGWMSVSSTRSGSLASECGDGWWEKTGRGWSWAQLYWHWREVNYRKLSKPSLLWGKHTRPDQPHLERITNIMGLLFQHFYAESLLTVDHYNLLKTPENTWDCKHLLRSTIVDIVQSCFYGTIGKLVKHQDPANWRASIGVFLNTTTHHPELIDLLLIVVLMLLF